MSFGQMIVRVVEGDRAHSEKIIASGRYKWLCQDWQCPSASFCGRHFGLSERYAAMREQKANEALVRPARDGDCCDHFTFATRDHFAESLGQKRRFPTTAQIGRA